MHMGLNIFQKSAQIRSKGTSQPCKIHFNSVELFDLNDMLEQSRQPTNLLRIKCGIIYLFFWSGSKSGRLRTEARTIPSDQEPNLWWIQTKGPQGNWCLASIIHFLIKLNQIICIRISSSTRVTDHLNTEKFKSLRFSCMYIKPLKISMVNVKILKQENFYCKHFFFFG